MRGIVFDLDGVLVFTDRFHFMAWKQMADAIGVYFDEEINHRLRGVSRRESLDIILERCEGPLPDEAEKERLAGEKNAIYRELLQNMSPADVTEEVRTTLSILRRRGYRLAIGSSSKNARFILQRVDLTTAFDAISDGTNITRSKPDPEVFQKAAEYLSLPDGECAVVEDAFAGIEAAKAAGMTAVAMGDATKDPRADLRLSSFSDLLSLFPSLFG